MGRRGKKERGNLGTWLFTRGLPVAALTRNGGGSDIFFWVLLVGPVKDRTGPDRQFFGPILADRAVHFL